MTNWLVVTGTWLSFSHILKIVIPIDELIFFREIGIPPTSWCFAILWLAGCSGLWIVLYKFASKMWFEVFQIKGWRLKFHRRSYVPKCLDIMNRLVWWTWCLVRIACWYGSEVPHLINLFLNTERTSFHPIWVCLKMVWQSPKFFMLMSS